MPLVSPVNDGTVLRLVEDSRLTDVTYDAVGATLAGVYPGEFRHHHYALELGSGLEVFHRAVRGLQTWQAHRVLGMRIFPAAIPIERNQTVVVTIGTSLLSLAAPCRIVEVLDTSDSWGFAYGTLQGHPEQGEESFVVSRDKDEEVRFTITAFSRPSNRITQLAGPLQRSAQKHVTKGYLHALQRFVDRY